MTIDTLLLRGESQPVRWERGSTVVTMNFDRMGRRVFYKEVVAGEVVAHHKFVYDNYLCVQKVDALNNNAQINLFVWDPTEPVATRPLFTTGSGNRKFFYTCDGNKNVSELVHFETRNGIAAHYDYAPFGAVTRSVSASAITDNTFTTDNPFRFSSEYADDALGLVYYNYRHYDPCVGRWLNRDPIEEKGGENLYSFCDNNPIEKSDRDGCAYFAYRPLDIPVVKHLGITINFDWMDKDNVAVLHEQLFFEDGGIPTNQGYFDDNQVRIDTAGIQYNTPHSTGWNDCIMRKAVRAVRPRPYSLLGDEKKGIAKYNCQDWAAEVRVAYWTIASGREYHPWGYTEMRSRP